MFNKKANHGTLILFIVIMFLSTFIFAMMLEFGVKLAGNGFMMEERANLKFSSDFEVIAIYAFGTEDSKIDGGNDNITIIARLDKDSTKVPFEDILIQFKAQNIQQNFKFNVGPTLNGTSYTYDYANKGSNYIDGYIQTGDVVNLNFQLPTGYSVPEDTYILMDVIYIKKNTNVPIRFTLPAGLINHKTYLYP